MIMFKQLKTFCSNTVDLNEQELKLIDTHFQVIELNKKDFLIQSGEICNFIGFIQSGIIRHFYCQHDQDKTCQISFENSWVTDFQSFNQNTPSLMSLQALEKTTVFIINKQDLYKLYELCPKYETFARIMTEIVVQRATDMAMSIYGQTPEQRFETLIQNQPDLQQRVSQKLIADFLGIRPESLSRIRNRIIKKQKS